MEEGFRQIDWRFDQLERQIDQFVRIMIGFMYWDRRTTARGVSEPILTALREYTKAGPQMTAILERPHVP